MEREERSHVRVVQARNHKSKDILQLLEHDPNQQKAAKITKDMQKTTKKTPKRRKNAQNNADRSLERPKAPKHCPNPPKTLPKPPPNPSQTLPRPSLNL